MPIRVSPSTASPFMMTYEGRASLSVERHKQAIEPLCQGWMGEEAFF